jgi:hypothetical protein
VSASGGTDSNPLRRGAARAASAAPWLVDVVRFAANPAWERALRRDLRVTRKSTAFLRELPAAGIDAPIVLVACYRDDVYETKMGLVLASALRLRGMRPVVSMPTNRGLRIRRYALAFGVEDVVAFDQRPLTADQRAEVVSAKDELLRSGTEFDAVKDWAFRGHQAGAHVLSTLIRTTFDGSPDLAVGDTRARLSPILDDVLENYVRADALFDELCPAVVLVQESNYSVNGPTADVATARGADVIHSIDLWRDDAIMSKRLTAANRRTDPKSASTETVDRLVDTVPAEERDDAVDADFVARYSSAWTLGRVFQPDTETRTPDEIVTELGLDPTKPTAVVFAHVLWDATLFFGVDLFANYADWLVRTIGAAIANPAVNWIVKAHPSNVARAAHGDTVGVSSEVTLVREHFAELPDHVRLLLPDTKISTRSLFDFADYGITVRGTAGLEMAAFGKPVFTAGTGTYAGFGFTYDSESTAEYLGRLATITTYGPLDADMTARARDYAYALFVRRPWAPRSFRPAFDIPERGWHPLDRNVELCATSVADVTRFGDLDDWAAWVLDTRDDDYVAPVAAPLPPGFGGISPP